MKKSELQTGMLIKNRRGDYGIVLRYSTHDVRIAGIPGEKSTTWSDCTGFTEDLKYPGNEVSDIIEVWSTTGDNNMDALSPYTKVRILLWTEPKSEVQLNSAYKAIIDRDNKIVKVGCQEIPFSKVEELHSLIVEDNKSKI